MTLVIDQVLQNRYRIVSRLGQGGMGAVYRAWDTRLEVLLAVKEMTPQPGLDSRTLTQLRQQFQQEATVLARLDHPYLVRVTDFFSEAANAYLVMNFVEGESLADWIAQHGRLPEQDVLAWADQLLDALAYCHDQGVIHRDVKPQNVIIRPDGRAVLVDFGLVKLWDPNDPRTRTAMRGMGTPEYAPPEQYDVAAGHTDARSDVYSLGATLYHALSGQVPPTATMRIVNPESLASVRTLVPGVSTETERAVTRAMELQPTARFQSAAEMRATLSDLALSWPQTRVMTEAQPATPAPLRRIPMWVWGLGAVAAVAVITVLLSSAMGANALSSHAPAAEPLPTAVATTRSPAALSPPTPTRRPTSTSVRMATSTPLPTATPTPALPQPAAAIVPQNAAQVVPLASIRKGVLRVAWLPDNNTLVAISTSRVYFFDTRTLEEMRTISRADAGIDATFRSLAVSPDGAILAIGTEEGIVYLWQVSDGTLLSTLEGHTQDKGVTDVAFSPDGATLASSSIDETVRLWRVADGALLDTLEGHERWVMSVAFSPDGATVASGGDTFDNTVRLWRASDGAQLRTLEMRGHGSVASLAFSPDGETLASSWGDDMVRLWRVSDSALMHTLEHTTDVVSVAFSPDGEILASGTYDGTVWLWQASDGELLANWEGRIEGEERIGHLSKVRGLGFSPNGKLLASGAETIALWGIAP